MTSSFFDAIVAFLIVVGVIVLVVVVFTRAPWRARQSQRLDEIQRAAAADVADMRENDHYDPKGPGIQEEDDL